MSRDFRIDKDSIGEIQVPIDAYFGPFTMRAKEQYQITKLPPHRNFVKAFVMIKKAAAIANKELGVLPHEIADAIIQSCDEILSGKLSKEFVIETLNSGASTAFNMNCNEVIANRALEIIGRKKGEYDKVSPNDHVNMSQSSNDTSPTAIHLAIMMNCEELLRSLDVLIESLEKKSFEFREEIKIGRTHLMDAIPVTLGNEFGAYTISMRKCKDLIKKSLEELSYIALGGTAVGTGANAPKGYQELVVTNLAKISGLPLKPSQNLFFSLQSKLEVANCSSSIKNLALELSKISNDIRLMASGPMAGLAEITIPAVHAGSSIMPGKVNPSLSETLNMICFNVIGNDLSVSLAAQAGQFELNVMLGGMVKSVLDSTEMLTNFIPIFSKNMIDGIRANREKLQSYVQKSPILVTLLNPVIGYLKAAEVYKEALSSNRTIRDIVLERKLMTAEQFDEIMSKAKLNS
ncbi:aspartate ammonia-lyase [Candidatus Nitrosocosmicus franklandus]|uniref:Fumarate hydratase n=1 Tax=Candidatus Nitrosocosmicus franklandianus TaxID=1798806 RepID=A0A484IEU8_9ARCH|nr:aspartate ammonia-lyase [Candidatus Nitrosocosmicus franklandus]VFJ15347.1 Putative fumarate hydratase [Candidatus Nitrosocosmicus franklandus]